MDQTSRGPRALLRRAARRAELSLRPPLVALAILALLIAQVVTLSPGATSSEPAASGMELAEPAPAAPAESPPARITAADAVDAGAHETGDLGARETEADPAPAPDRQAAAGSSGRSASSDPARQRFERRFPEQARAGQDASRDPASTRWAVLVGINEHHPGGPRDNLTSRQDAETLHAHLRSLGWKEQNIVLLRDRDATREMIEQAIAWLSRKTNGNSLAVFHYSGHMRSWNHHTGRPDVALWPSDSRFIPAGDFARRLGAVGAGWMWVHIQACHAESMNVSGLRRTGRLLTFSSRAPEKSYEDPERGHTVLGHYLIARGMARGLADRDGDGDVTVQEAFSFGAPRATRRTSRASHGPQRPVIVNDAGRSGFSLRIPPPPQQEQPQDEDENGSCVLFVCP